MYEELPLVWEWMGKHDYSLNIRKTKKNGLWFHTWNRQETHFYADGFILGMVQEI